MPSNPPDLGPTFNDLMTKVREVISAALDVVDWYDHPKEDTAPTLRRHALDNRIEGLRDALAALRDAIGPQTTSITHEEDA